ncbi:MAG: DUF6440 family protein [Oscillospiraceae bacterium]|nr:DUF6440 family protein [Oscillospiraceae bacterium]
MSLTEDIREFFCPEPEKAEAEDEKGRFVLTGRQVLGGMLIYTVTDRETGVSYITKPGNGCMFTPLLDADGRPLLTK